MSKNSAKNIAVGIGLLVGAFRFYFESRMPLLVHLDAQGGMWIAYAVIVSSVTFFLVTSFLYLALCSLNRNNRAVAVVCAIVVGGVLVWTGGRVLELRGIENALHDANSPDTEPERLRELIGYETGFGYEIDNRIAANPNSPEDILRRLYSLPNQSGTVLNLARNPNTPDDILLQIMKSEDDLTRRHLKLNLRFSDLEVRQNNPDNQ